MAEPAEIEVQPAAEPVDDPAPTVSAPAGVPAEYAEVLNIINEKRAAAGLAPLVWDDNLAAAAQVRAREAATTWSHTRPDGSAWWTADSRVVYGECLARGYNDSSSLVDAWMASPTHRDVLMGPGYHTVAFAVYDAPNGLRYVAQEFGL